MKNTLFCLFIFCSVSTFAQNGITFKVEKLSKPEELLHLDSPNEIYESLILSDMNIEPYEIKEKNIKVPYHIIAKSESPDSLVSFGPNSFFNGMYQAYARKSENVDRMVEGAWNNSCSCRFICSFCYEM